MAYIISSPKLIHRLSSIAAIVILLFLFSLSFSNAPIETWYGLLPSPVSSPVRCTPAGQLISEFAGGVPGFLVFENVWFFNDTFYYHIPSTVSTSPFPTQDQVFSGPVKLVHYEWPFDAWPDHCFLQTSIFLNEGAAPGWNGLWHYYHFAAENILGAFAALGVSVSRESSRSNESHQDGVSDEGKNNSRTQFPERIFIPWEAGWRDKWGMNEMVLRALFGDRVIEKAEWEKLNEWNGRLLYFERVVIVDRWASHRHNFQADQWNKMAVPIFDLRPSFSFFEEARRRMWDYHDITPAHTAEGRKEKIVYIDRQNTDRKLYDQDHEALLEVLSDIGKERGVRVESVFLEELDKREQIMVVADATIMIGIHGNGLTHEMWMPQESTLIELFPSHSFLRDYEAVAQVLGHGYMAIRNDTAFTVEECIAFKGEQGAGAMHDGTTISVDASVLRKVIEDILDGQ